MHTRRVCDSKRVLTYVKNDVNMEPKCSKMEPTWRQNEAKWHPHGPRWVPDGPRDFKMAPRWPQGGSKSPQDAPKKIQDGSKGRQDEPKKPQDGFISDQHGAKIDPRQLPKVQMGCQIEHKLQNLQFQKMIVFPWFSSVFSIKMTFWRLQMVPFLTPCEINCVT